MTAARTGAVGPAKVAATPKARSRVAKAVRDIQLEDDENLTPVEAMQAEVDNEESDDESLTVRLVTKNGEADIRIPHPVDWSARATDLLADARVHSWAQLTFSDTDWERWLELDPTNGEANEFIGAWRTASGQNEGKSRASRRSSRSMRRK